MSSWLGDPDPFGILLTVGYFVAAIVCYLPLKYEPRKLAGFGQRLFWMAVSGYFLLLAVNKQADAHMWLIELLKSVARAQEWDTYRRYLKPAFTILLSIAAFTLSLACWLKIRRWPMVYRVVLAGVVFQTAVICLRIAIMNRLDAEEEAEYWQLGIIRALEVVGMLVSSTAALKFMKRTSRDGSQKLS